MPVNKSWAPEVSTAGDPPDEWTRNAMRFATKGEADQWGLDLSMRWTTVRDVRSTESTDPVNYRIQDGKVESLG